ncbi:endospore germination permease [Paenibacillus filicis]|uniref:Endospore germination permease n=1 Tax=Paenibacillus filicis TaxID=669464 RepID=A0ABU9DIS5_9BACL
MEKPVVLNVRAFAVLVTFFMIGTSILITPSALSFDAKQDAWLACIIGVGMNVAAVFLYVRLGERFPQQTLVQYCETILGKWIGKAVALGFVLFFFLLASLMVGDLGYFLTSQIMQETPMEVLQMMFVLVVVMTVRLGLAVYTRAAVLFFPWTLLLFTILILPLIPKFQWNLLLPFLEYGWSPVMRGSFSFWGLQEMIVMLMFYPYVARKPGRKSAFVTGVVLGGAILVLTTLGSITVLGTTLTTNQLFPAYTLAKNISLGHFFERVEGIMISIWVISIFFKIVLTFHASVHGLVQLLRFKEEKVLVLPLGLGMIVMSLMCYPNTIFIKDYLGRNWAPLSLIFGVVLPLLLLVVSSVTRGLRRGKG